MFDKKEKRKKSIQMKPHFKFIYTRKLFLNCKLLTIADNKNMSTISMKMWKKKTKIEKQRKM
jgi:hypothetical protein